jgi:type I restriction-modification system DNA methylase subunit
MTNNNSNYERIVNNCFDILRGIFTTEQAYHLMIGASAFLWIRKNEKYSVVNVSIDDFINSDDASGLLIEKIYNFENHFCEFQGVLSGLLGNVFTTKDKSLNQKIKTVFEKMNSLELKDEGETVYFINRLVSIGASKCGIIETPYSIRMLIKNFIELNKIKTMADFCSGLSSIAGEVIFDDIFYYGVENNISISSIAAFIMLINKIENFKIENKDILFNYENNMKFNFIISDFPQNLNLFHDLNPNDPRFIYGIPDKVSADWAFAQNVIYHLDDKGIGLIVCTKGTLVRTNEIKIRKKIVEADIIECVITLPQNLYEKVNIGTEIIIFNKNKNLERKKKILFINASEFSYRINKSQHAITNEAIVKIIDCYRNGKEIEDFSKFVEYDKIEEFKYTLNPAEYLHYDLLRNSFKNTVALGEVAKITRGVQIQKDDSNVQNFQKSHYMISVKDVDGGKVFYDNESMIKIEKQDWIGKYDIKPNDIIVTSKGWQVKFAIVDDEFKPALINSNLTKIRVDPKKYNAHVLFEFLQGDIGKKMIEGLQTGTTIKLINTTQLARLEIPVFDIRFMNEIGEEIKRNRLEYEKSIEEANRKFKSNREKIDERLKQQY